MARPTAAPGAPGTSVVAAAARGPHVVRRALAAGETWVFAALIIMMAIFTGLAPGKFLTLNDLSLNAQTTAPFLLMSVGETFVIITAGIDLSVGFVLVLSGVVAGEYYLSNGGPNAGAGTIWVGAIFGLAYFSTTTISGHPLDNLVVITAEMKAKYPNITVLGTQYDNDSSATAASQVEADITAHPNLSGVFATNVLSAQGAATGIQHAGASGKVKVATFDAEPQQITGAQVEHHPARHRAEPLPRGPGRRRAGGERTVRQAGHREHRHPAGGHHPGERELGVGAEEYLRL